MNSVTCDKSKSEPSPSTVYVFVEPTLCVMLSNFGKLNCAPPLRLIFVLSRFVTFGALKFCVEFFNVITELESVSKDGAETLAPSERLSESHCAVFKLEKSISLVPSTVTVQR